MKTVIELIDQAERTGCSLIVREVESLNKSKSVQIELDGFTFCTLSLNDDRLQVELVDKWNNRKDMDVGPVHNAMLMYMALTDW